MVQIKHKTQKHFNYRNTPQGFKLQDGPILKRFRSSVSNLSKLCSTQRLTSEMVEHVFKVFDHNCRHRGKASAIKTAKDHYNCVLKLLSGSKASSAQWGHEDRRGLPKVLKPLRRLIWSKDPMDIRAVLTLLSHYRAMQAPGKIDLSPITRGGTAPTGLTASRIGNHAPKFRGKVDLSTIYRPSLCYTTKTGPNGPGLLTAWDDLAALKKSPNVLRHLWTYIRRFRSNPLPEKSSSLEENILATFDSVSIPVTKQVYHSRLSVKREFGGKDRVFAISDYYSKMALKPFHEAVANILRGIPEDYTFDQDRAAAWIKNMQVQGVTLYSYDLTNATDRFPISVQQMVVWKLTRDRSFSRIWKDLVSDRDFVFKRKLYRYEVGQPMGFYSSWPVFALSHHCVVKEAAKRAGVKRPRYALLGDDIVVEEAIAPSYLDVIRELGVDISENKSLWGTWAEFAKRVFVGGQEVTPLPNKLVLQVTQDPLVLGSLMDHWLRLPSSTGSWEDQFRSLFAALALKENQRRKFDIAATSLALWTYVRKIERKTSPACLATDPSESPLVSQPEGRNRDKLSTSGPLLEHMKSPSFIGAFMGYIREHKFENLLDTMSKLIKEAPEFRGRLDQLLSTCGSTSVASNHPGYIAWSDYLRDLDEFLVEVQQIFGQSVQFGEIGMSLPRPKSPNLSALTRQGPVTKGRADIQAYSQAFLWAEERATYTSWVDEMDIDEYSWRKLRTDVRTLRQLLSNISSNQ